MEKAGTGIQRVKDACSSNGNKILFDFTDSFWVTIETNENVTENREQSILNLILTNKYITTTKLAQLLNVNRRTIARDIESLKNQDKLIRVGGDKGGYWDVI